MVTKVHTRQIPLAKLAMLLAIGITLYRVISPLDLFSLFNVAIVLGVFFLFYYSLRYKWKTPILMLIVVLVGTLISGLKDESLFKLRLSPELIASTPHIEMEVEEIRHYKKSTALIGSIISVNDIMRQSPRLILYARKNDEGLQEIRRGSVVSSGVRLTTIDISENQSFEAYNSYLIDQGINYTGFINPTQYVVTNDRKYSWLKVIRYDAREWALKTLDTYLTGDANAITRALLLGDKSRISQETREKYAHSGIIHILAVSGLHVGFIVMFLIGIFNSVFYKLSPFSWVKVAFVSVALIGYVELSGGAPPVRRAVIMAILYLIAKALRKEFSPINIIGFAAILLLFISPNELFTVSFQLSFAAVTGIILLMPYLMNLCTYEQTHIRKLWGVVSIGIAAQISTFPITLYYFNQVPLFSALAGVIAIPVTFLALCNGVLILLFGGVSEYIANLLSIIQELLINVLNGVAQFFSNLPFSIWDSVSLIPIESMLLIAAILGVAFYLNTKRSVALVFATFLLLVQAATHTSIVILNYRDSEVGLIYYEKDAIGHSKNTKVEDYE